MRASLVAAPSAFAALAVLAACGQPPPPATSSTSAPRAAASAAEPDHTAARAVAAACEDKLGPGWEVERRRDAGHFSLVIAHAKGTRPFEPAERKGCVATAAGSVVAQFDDVVSAGLDLDGDRRANLVLSRTVLTPSADDDSRIEPVVVADRPGGPVVLPIDGYDATAAWSVVVVVPGQPASVELRYPDKTLRDRQRLAWNGKALASSENAWAHVRCHQVAHSTGARCAVIGAAYGRVFEKALSVSDVNVSPLEDLHIDFAGDGSRFIRVRWFMAPSGREYDDKLIADLIVLHLGSKGWEEASLPWFDDSALADRDGDGRPEIETSGSAVRVTDCVPKSSGCKPAEAFGIGLLTWDGSDFSSTAPRLAAAYAKASVAVAAGACPTELVGAAGLAYLKARWAGASEADGLARAEEVVRRGDPQRCPASAGKPRPFAAYGAALAGSLDEFLPAGVPRARRRK